MVPFTKDEYKKIKPVADRMRVTFFRHEFGDGVVYFAKKFRKALGKIENNVSMEKIACSEKLDCPFLEFDKDGKSSCIIYENRPEICRRFGSGEHKFLTCPNNKHMKSY